MRRNVKKKEEYDAEKSRNVIKEEKRNLYKGRRL